MGLVRTMLTLKNPRHPELEGINVEARADTGSVHMCIPEHVKLQLGLQECDRKEVTLTDGSAWTGSIFPAVRLDRPRLVDLLNDTPLHFVALFAPDQLLAVGLRHLAFARPVA